MNTPISALLERKGSQVHAVAPAMTVSEAVAEMNRHRVGCVVVIAGGDLAGIFTERDILRRVVGEGRDPGRSRVADVMTPDPYTIGPDTTIEEAMEIFTQKRCRHLPVIAAGRLSGIVSIGDVTRWMVDVHRTECEHLKNYIAGGFPA